jgi:hypothetical protein
MHRLLSPQIGLNHARRIRMDSNVVGAAGQNGNTGLTLGASGTSGSAGGDAGANASSATDATNTAEASGGHGGDGGNGAANNPPQGGGRAGNGGAGGNAVATATVTAATEDGNTATATATGGTGGGGGVGGAPSALGGVGGNGGGAKATATATNTDGAAKATATAMGGTGGVSQYDTPGPYPGGYVGNVYASGNGANVAGSSATANGTTSATATVTQTGGSGNSGPAGGDGGSSTLMDAVSGTTDDGTLSLEQTAAGGDGGEGGLYAGRGASGGDATSDLTLDDTSSKQVSADVVATGGDGGIGQLATGGAATIGPGGTGEASGTITGSSTVYETVEAGGGDSDAVGGAANATGTGTAGTLAGVYVSAGGGEANGIGGTANAVATGNAAQAIVTAYADGGQGSEAGGAATAQATATGQTGTATASAATNYFDNATRTYGISAEATSVAPVAGTSEAVAAISQGDTLGAFDTTAQSVATAVFDPSAASNGTDFVTGDNLFLDTEQGGGNFASVTGDVTVTNTLEGYLDLSANSPDSHVLLDLHNATLVGTGVTAVDVQFRIGSQILSQTFSSGAAAEAFFSHDLIDLGPLSDSSEFSDQLTRTLVDIEISVSVDAPLSGFYANGQVAIEPASAAAPDVFQEGDAATTGTFSGDYLWSNAGNWVGDQPAAGSNVEMAGVGVDDIAGLSLVSLSVSPPSGNGTEGKLSVYDDLTVNVLTVAASSEIDIVGPAQLNVTGAATIDGTIVTDPSTLTVEGTVTGAGTIDIGAGSNVIFDGAVAATETVDFVSSTGTLTIADPADFAAQVVGSGTEIVICYLRGTRVATPDGDLPIETLVHGDRLLTRFGGVRPIKWIGRQSFAAGFLARELWPVRIAAGALGHARPARDLCVSPGHSMLIEDRLILARNLVNGVTVTQSRPTGDVHYYQVEFEAHDCILAEGAWSESYADAQGLRNRFHNAGEFRALFPDATSPAEPALCAPRPQSGPELQAALMPIVSRAAAGLVPGILHGWIERIEADGIVGWAQDTAYPELPVLLEVWLGDELLGTVLACEFRGDLAAAGIGRGYCRFGCSIVMPAGWAGALTIRRAADGAVLPPTDALRALLADRHGRCAPPEAPGPLQGWIDRVEPDRIDGWAQDVGHPGRPVRLAIWLRDTLLGTVVASSYRRDLEVAGIGRGYCGFSFATRAGISARHLTICRVADGAMLPMTPALKATAA